MLQDKQASSQELNLQLLIVKFFVLFENIKHNDNFTLENIKNIIYNFLLLLLLFLELLKLVRVAKQNLNLAAIRQPVWDFWYRNFALLLIEIVEQNFLKFLNVHCSICFQKRNNKVDKIVGKSNL